MCQNATNPPHPPLFFRSGVSGGRHLEVHSSTIECTQVWTDDDRPRLVVWEDCTVRDCSENGLAPSETLLNDTLLRQVRGDDEDASSTGSLEVQEFAGVERLIEQLDIAELNRDAR